MFIKKYSLQLLVGFCLFFNSAFAASKNTLADVAAKYRKSNLVTIQLVKTVKSTLLGKETKYKGTVYLATNKFRLNIDEPDKSQIIFDGKTIWNVQFPPKELPGPVQVAKSKLDKNSKKQILLSTLIAKDGIKENFKITKEEKLDEGMKFSLVPLKGELNIKSLDVTVKNNKISSINYADDVGNTTTFVFEKTEFSSKPSSQLFKYKVPKDAQVTNL